MRRGIAELNGEGEVVGGVIVMRFGENAKATIDRVKARLADGVLTVTIPKAEKILTQKRGGCCDDNTSF